ncbi:MAG TPA: response regulator [Verrucomicrobiae bacterium]|nr:response regulator [Verrucomicrobiae bacterium]
MPSPKPILIAEDSEDDVVFLKHAFKHLGIVNPVYIVHDGDETIAYLKGEGQFADREKYPLPYVLFVDLKMPRRNGFEVLAWLKGQQQFNDMLTVVLTVRTEMQDVTRAYALGADSFLVKPCLPDEIENLANYYRDYWVFAPVRRKKPLPGTPPGRTSKFLRSLVLF